MIMHLGLIGIALVAIELFIVRWIYRVVKKHVGLTTHPDAERVQELRNSTAKDIQRLRDLGR